MEANIELTVVAHAENRGWLCRKIAYVGRRNAADRFFAKAGKMLFVEFKDTGKTPRPGQEREIARLRAAGVEVHVIDRIADGLALFP